MVIFVNEEPFIPTNNKDIDCPIINGEVAPVLGTYELYPDSDDSIQVAYAWID